MTTSLYVVGYNYRGIFGWNYPEDTKRLVKLDMFRKDFEESMELDLFGECAMNTTEVIFGWRYAIYHHYTKEYQEIWMTGKNDYGQCATNDFEPLKHDGFHCITYFEDRNIKIRKICAKTTGDYNVFWITDKNQVYANGANWCWQFGIDNNDNQPTPILISQLENVFDIQSANNYTIALCSNTQPNRLIIISFWCRILQIDVPKDIETVIMNFHDINEVFSTGYHDEEENPHPGNGQGRDAQFKLWSEIDGLKNKRIQQMAIAPENSFFLDSSGTVWCCGGNGYNMLGLGHAKTVYEITAIEFFVTNGIKIREIKCGRYFAIMVDYDDRVWITGDIHDWRVDSVDRSCPSEIMKFRDLNVETVQCGKYHAMVKCKGNKYYMWGDNCYHQCLVFDDLIKTINIPVLVEIKGKKIKDICLGSDCTAVIVSNE